MKSLVDYSHHLSLPVLLPPLPIPHPMPNDDEFSDTDDHPDCEYNDPDSLSATIDPRILHSRHLSIMHFNIRGLLNKLPLLRELISTLSDNNARPDAIPQNKEKTEAAMSCSGCHA